jgi:hypothetical protein
VFAPGPFHGETAPRRNPHITLRSVLRRMRENCPLIPTRVGSARLQTHGPPDARWHDHPRNGGHDGLTAIFTCQGQAAVFATVDHCSAERVGIHTHARSNRFEALKTNRQGVRRHVGGAPAPSRAT